MARVTPFEFYVGYRFVLEAKDGTTVGAERVWSDPFDPECLWVVRAHGVEQQTLAEWIGHCIPIPSDENGVFTYYHCRVILKAKREPSDDDRVLHVKFRSWKWLPLDLDAKSEEVAREHLKLEGVEYGLIPRGEQR